MKITIQFTGKEMCAILNAICSVAPDSIARKIKKAVNNGWFKSKYRCVIGSDKDYIVSEAEDGKIDIDIREDFIEFMLEKFAPVVNASTAMIFALKSVVSISLSASKAIVTEKLAHEVHFRDDVVIFDNKHPENVGSAKESNPQQPDGEVQHEYSGDTDGEVQHEYSGDTDGEVQHKVYNV